MKDRIDSESESLDRRKNHCGQVLMCAFLSIAFMGTLCGAPIFSKADTESFESEYSDEKVINVNFRWLIDFSIFGSDYVDHTEDAAGEDNYRDGLSLGGSRVIMTAEVKDQVTAVIGLHMGALVRGDKYGELDLENIDWKEVVDEAFVKIQKGGMALIVGQREILVGLHRLAIITETPENYLLWESLQSPDGVLGITFQLDTEGAISFLDQVELSVYGGAFELNSEAVGFSFRAVKNFGDAKIVLGYRRESNEHKNLPQGQGPDDEEAVTIGASVEFNEGRGKTWIEVGAYKSTEFMNDDGDYRRGVSIGTSYKVTPEVTGTGSCNYVEQVSTECSLALSTSAIISSLLGDNSSIGVYYVYRDFDTSYSGPTGQMRDDVTGGLFIKKEF